MNLLQPLALLGLAVLPIILILHMLRARRRRVTVSSARLWRDLPPPTVGARRRRIPWTLVLLLQLLVAALVVAALARPTLMRFLSGRPMHHIVILDTTTSMLTQEGGRTRFDVARDQAARLINGLGNDDRVTLIAMSAAPHVLAQVSAADKAEAAAALDRLSPGATGTDLATALYLADGVVDASYDNQITVLSDKALGPASRRDLPTSVAAPLVWPSLGHDVGNQSLQAVSARRRADGQTAIFARVANASAVPGERHLQLLADGDRIADAPVRLTSEGDYEQVWTVPAGVKTVEVRLAGQDALAADDRAFLSLEEGRRRSAVVVGKNTDALARALRANPTLRVTTVTPENYTPAPDTELTVFEGFLPATLPPGGVIIVSPPADSVFRAGAPRQNLAIERGDDPLVGGIDLGAVRFDNIPKVTLPGWAQPVVSVQGYPLVARGQNGSSRVVALTFDLKQTNLTAKLAFPVLLARAVAEVTRPPLPPVVLAGQPVPLAAGPGAALNVARQTDAGEQPVALGQSGMLDRTETPGLYTATESRGGLVTWSGRFAVHAGSALESDVRPQAVPGFQAAPPAPSPSSGETSGREVWMFLALAALIALGVEAVVARR